MGTPTMNQLFCFVFGLVAVYDVCQAQFGFASQNCLGSNCNQNNLFGRRRRQVLEDILAEVEEKELAKHNEVVRIKREIADMLNSLTIDVLEQEAKKEEAVVVEEDVHTQAKRDAEADPQFAFQNCVSSNCNQNNLFGRKKREIAETIESLVHEQVKSEAEADPQFAISNCVGSNCNTNNFFKGKRETLELIKSVAKEMLEAEEEDATVKNEDKEAD